MTVITAIGTDRESEIVLDTIAQLGLEASLSRLPGTTSIQYIDRHPSGEKIFVRYEQGVLEGYRVGERERRVIADSDLLVTTLYAQIQGFFDSVMDAPSRGLRAVDFCDLSDSADGVATVARYVDRFHVGFFGLQSTELRLIAGLEELARRADRLFVLTLGREGSLALHASGRVVCPPAPVARVVDTTGAGDTFAAGFLAEYCYSKSVQKSLARGSEKAARTIERVGAFEAALRPWPESFRHRASLLK